MKIFAIMFILVTILLGAEVKKEVTKVEIKTAIPILNQDNKSLEKGIFFNNTDHSGGCSPDGKLVQCSPTK